MASASAGDFADVKGVQWIAANFPLETPEELAAFRHYVTDNPYWQGTFEYGDDLLPPAQITDLSASLAGSTIQLSWTAPGDDADRGQASGYVAKVRSQGLHTGIDFAAEPWRLWSEHQTKELVDAPRPQPAGNKELMLITNLGAGTHLVAIQTVDDARYHSKISNVVTVTIP